MILVYFDPIKDVWIGMIDFDEFGWGIERKEFPTLEQALAWINSWYETEVG